MEFRRLGHTDTEVSIICLGTMTFGEQNSEAQGHQQMDYAFDNGVNFFDTAELYSIPPKAETYGRTEEIIGSWLATRGCRDRLILASKIAGPAMFGQEHIRNGQTQFNRDHIEVALDNSLRRLQTDYIDLYQLHWPERDTNCFGKLGYDGTNPDPFTPIEETLQTLQRAIDAGKIRYIGLSNETPWGVMRFIEAAERLGLPKVVSIQNPYSLLNRSYEVGLAEVSVREGCGLLAYSPLGFGVLSGKYLDNVRPAGARLTLWPDYSRYTHSLQAVQATRGYVTLAQDHQLDAAQMALAYVNSRPFVTSNIIGATTMEQLASNIASTEVKLNDALLNSLESIHSQYPNPSP